MQDATLRDIVHALRKKAELAIADLDEPDLNQAVAYMKNNIYVELADLLENALTSEEEAREEGRKWLGIG
jgi:uncharacterized protein YlxP (DUF503 family)